MTNINPQKSPKILEIFECNFCNYVTRNKKDYNKHLTTRKHEIRTNTKKYEEKSPKIPTAYICECGKKYKHASSLWNHKKREKCYFQAEEHIESTNETSDVIDICNTDDNVTTTTVIKPANRLDPETVKELILQNKELRDQLMKKDELMEKMIDRMGSANSTTNNTQNNHFNINVFLNEQCKDAINFSDFIERIEISHDDLENNAQLGFVDGISKILMDNLKQLTVHERPIHCTDVKRETMYIKDDNEWQKEKETNTQKLNDAIQEISRKSMTSLMEWKRTNPDYQDADSEFSNKCIAMQQQSIAITKKEQYYPKVVHKIARESAIDKSFM